jgi:hypothetical protein
MHEVASAECPKESAPEAAITSVRRRVAQLAAGRDFIPAAELWGPLGFKRTVWYDHLATHPELVVRVGRRVYLTPTALEAFLGGRGTGE